jgi:anthranilate synthase component 1
MPTRRARGLRHCQERLADLKALLRQPVQVRRVLPTGHPAEREFAKADYIAAVERAKELIAGGDFMQVQVGQRIQIALHRVAPVLYRALRSLNPSPLHVLLQLRGAIDFHVVGASPEILVRQERVTANDGAARKSPSARWPAPGHAVRRPSRQGRRA